MVRWIERGKKRDRSRGYGIVNDRFFNQYWKSLGKLTLFIASTRWHVSSWSRHEQERCNLEARWFQRPRQPQAVVSWATTASTCTWSRSPSKRISWNCLELCWRLCSVLKRHRRNNGSVSPSASWPTGVTSAATSTASATVAVAWTWGIDGSKKVDGKIPPHEIDWES